MITSLMLLDAAECAQIEQAIDELRPHWVPRDTGPVNGFFTLGAASYLDGPAEYVRRAAALNPILAGAFSPLYERVCEFLATRLGAPARFATGLAMPGFHIWLAPAIFVSPIASVHFDLQYLRAWPEGTPDLETSRPLSFTLPIRLPHQGGGLNVWDVTFERYRAFVERVPGRVQPADVAMLLPRMRHPYTPGAIAMHSGHLLHQIAEIDEVRPGDRRVTLQGHALRQRGEWKLYW